MCHNDDGGPFRWRERTGGQKGLPVRHRWLFATRFAHDAAGALFDHHNHLPAYDVPWHSRGLVELLLAHGHEYDGEYSEKVAATECANGPRQSQTPHLSAQSIDATHYSNDP